MNRRNFLELSGLGIVGLQTSPFNNLFTAPQKIFVYVSSWTKDSPHGGGQGGIHVFTLNTADGSLEHVSTIESDMNAGNLCISRDKKFLYAVDEIKNYNGMSGNGGGVYSYAINPTTGELTFLNKQPSMGAFPCHITTDPKGKFIVLANHGSYDCISNTIINNKGAYEVVASYDDGSVAMFPLKDDGTINPLSYLDVHKGHGTHPFFQQCPHPHAVIISEDGRYAVVCDKGNDTITAYKTDAKQGKLITNTPYKTKAGSGPRHAVFHPSLPYLFVINEAVSSLSSFHFNTVTGDLSEIDTQPTIPQDFTDTNYPADIRIHPNGMFLFGSNRGHDSIITFKIDQNTGKLTLVATTPTAGKNPREFNLTPSGQHLLVGNLDSNQIVTFSVNAESGRLTQSSVTNTIAKPVCIHVLSF